LNQQSAIDYLLQNDFKKMPQQPQWVDGSGLSRYNLISPEDEIFVMNQLIDSFGTNRLLKILPTGGKGTLKKMFLTESNEMFAKTGSMSNIYCLTGMINAANGKKLLFSIMLNNYNGAASSVKKGIEQFLRSVKEN
jgi:D-alanyl-D-alanine carboxypeptidase/D-alanyl-D-alanine-endopeptidase (penicillin-binding protein 4)